MTEQEVLTLIRTVLTEEAARERAWDGVDRRAEPAPGWPTLHKVAAAVAALGVLCASVVASASFSYKYFLAPQVQTAIQSEIAAHEVTVRREMAGISGQLDAKYASRGDFVAFTTEKEAKWARQDEINRVLAEGVTELRVDMKEVLRRLPR